MKRKFEDLLINLKTTIADYKYYTDFEKAYVKSLEYKNELNILNELIGTKLSEIETKFLDLLNTNPNIIKAIPIMLALRKKSVSVIDEKLKIFNFDKNTNSDQDYLKFMNETGVFKLLSEGGISNIQDYILGVEVGLDSNARKNRTGFTMENIVKNFLLDIPNIEFDEQFTKKNIFDKYGINIVDNDILFKAEKKFDYVVKTEKTLFLIEVNFFSGQGSKLNETAKSFKSLNDEFKKNKEIMFIWITDGIGWLSAKNNLRESFESMEHLFILKDLEEGALKNLFRNNK